MRRGVKTACGLLFAAYLLAMFYLLLFRQRDGFLLSRALAHGEYWENVRACVNLTPFDTIVRFLRTIETQEGYFVRHAFINLVGNVVMFVPLGVFLPLLWRKMRAYWRFFLLCALAITLVEAAQALLLRGSADIDDLILNLAGATTGFPFGLLAARIFDEGERKT